MTVANRPMFMCGIGLRQRALAFSLIHPVVTFNLWASSSAVRISSFGLMVVTSTGCALEP